MAKDFPNVNESSAHTTKAIDQIITTDKSEIGALTEMRSHYQAPYSDLVEMGATFGFIVLAVAACSGIRRYMHHRRQNQDTKPIPDSYQPSWDTTS